MILELAVFFLNTAYNVVNGERVVSEVGGLQTTTELWCVKFNSYWISLIRLSIVVVMRLVAN